MKELDASEIRDYVRERYGALAAQSDDAGCCRPARSPNQKRGCGCGGGDAATPYAEKLGYSADDIAGVPEGTDLGLGCGNPLALASIRAGETVLDLGSGAGFDCLLAARQLQGTGRVIGVDMAPPMITKARHNAAKAGFANIEFRLGEIEHLPVADGSVDLIISNCVINLSPEKAQVFREAFRVLKPGGRLAIADVVATQPVPEKLRHKLAAIGACVAGAALVDEVKAMLLAAGFARVDVQPRENSRRIVAEWTEWKDVAEFVVSAYVTAYK